MPATEYGKYLKKLRIDKDKTLAAMAKDMGIAPSYLSVIESGERVIPVDFTEKISESIHWMIRQKMNPESLN